MAQLFLAVVQSLSGSKHTGYKPGFRISIESPCCKKMLLDIWLPTRTDGGAQIVPRTRSKQALASCRFRGGIYLYNIALETMARKVHILCLRISRCCFPNPPGEKRGDRELSVKRLVARATPFNPRLMHAVTVRLVNLRPLAARLGRSRSIRNFSAQRTARRTAPGHNTTMHLIFYDNPTRLFSTVRNPL